MFIEQLRQKYRIGGDLHFPNKRVYTSDDGQSWELNDLHVQEWAHHLVQHLFMISATVFCCRV